MKIRIKFSKQHPMQFIGHLDMMRYFQKAVRRARIDIAYSAGFSPHPIMSFAAPLGVGLVSNGEYFDMEIRSLEDEKTLCNKLNQAMVPGIRILSATILSDTAKNGMASVQAADYSIRFRHPDILPTDWKEQLLQFYMQDEILITKETKKNKIEMNLKPFVYDLHLEDDTVYMKVNASSSGNIKPTMVLEAFAEAVGISLPAYPFLISREETYGNKGTDASPVLVPLNEL